MDDKDKGKDKDEDKKTPEKKRGWIKRFTKKRRSKEFSKANAVSESQATNAVLSRPSTPPPGPVMEDDEANNVTTREDAHSGALQLQDVFLMKLREKDHEDSSSCGLRSFSSLEDLLDRAHYSDGVELDKFSAESRSDSHEALSPEAVDQPPGLDPYLGDHESAIEDQQHHQPELSVHTNEVDVTITNYDADIESDNEQDDSEHDETILEDPAKVDHHPEEPLNANPSTLEIHPQEDPSVAVVHNQDELDHVIAVPSSEVEERVSEPEVYITSPEAIVEEVEAVQVETAVETNGATSIIMTFMKNWPVVTIEDGTSLRLINTDESGTCLTDDQGEFVTRVFPSSATTFIRDSNDTTDKNNTSVSLITNNNADICPSDESAKSPSSSPEDNNK